MNWNKVIRSLDKSASTLGSSSEGNTLRAMARALKEGLEADPNDFMLEQNCPQCLKTRYPCRRGSCPIR